MPLEFRRGKEHIDKAKDRSQSGDYRPFLSTFFWPEDESQKFLLFLNPLEDIPTALISQPWTNNGRPELVMARTEEAIGEKIDPIEQEWGYPPRETNLAIVAELEPISEVVKDRKGKERRRPVAFEVKTRTFERRIRDKNGELTEEREEVTVPIIGLVAQSPSNFFNHVASKDANVAPIHEVAACVSRVGTGTATEYEVDLFPDQELNLDNLVENFGGINYLSNDEMNELIQAVDKADTAEDQSVLIGEALLNKRLSELADLDYYNEVLDSIDTVAKWPSKKFKGAKNNVTENTTTVAKAGRTKAKSSRRAVAETTEATETVAETPTDDHQSSVHEMLTGLRARSEEQSQTV